jgi:hypothetical protein
MELLSCFLGNNSTDIMNNTDSNIIDMANCTLCTKRLLAADFVILIQYNY